MSTHTTHDDNGLEHPVPGSPADQEAPNGGEANLGTPKADSISQDHTDERRMRRRAQAAEAERDKFAARLEGLQHAEVTRLTADNLAVPADLFTYGDGLTLADLTDDETGAVDPEKVNAAVEALLKARPGLAKVIPTPPPRPGTYQNAGQGRGYEPRPASTGWERVLG